MNIHDTQTIQPEGRKIDIRSQEESGSGKLEEGHQKTKGEAPRVVLTAGMKIGMLTLIKAVRFDSYKRWECLCDCGKISFPHAKSLRLGESKSCGCSHRTKHGDSGSKEFWIWCAMKFRCLNPNSKRYARYGGRGITICERWLDSYDNFLSDMGRCPSGYSLDRIDNDGNYCPENCRWATIIQQNNNNSRSAFIELRGRKLTITQWSRETNLSVATIYRRLKSGASPEVALAHPVKKSNRNYNCP